MYLWLSWTHKASHCLLLTKSEKTGPGSLRKHRLMCCSKLYNCSDCNSVSSDINNSPFILGHTASLHTLTHSNSHSHTGQTSWESISFRVVINPGPEEQVGSHHLHTQRAGRAAGNCTHGSTKPNVSAREPHRVVDHLQSTQQTNKQQVAAVESEHPAGQKGKVCSCWWIEAKG